MFRFIGFVTVLLLIAYATDTLDAVRGIALRGCDAVSTELARDREGGGFEAACPAPIVRFVAPEWDVPEPAARDV